MTRFKMIARDINSNPIQYRTWVVPNTPDLDGYYYTGYKSGSNALVDIVAYSILDDTVVADFNLPIPTSWTTTDNGLSNFPIKKSLLLPIEEAQIAVLDGYIYTFGGKITNKIFRSSVNNPADWVDTGATLPTALWSSQLAIVNSTIYLFGGSSGDGYNDGYGALDTIYTAPVSNPLQWTNRGSLLPKKISKSSLGMYNGSLYLFGGLSPSAPQSSIFTASTSSPLIWTDTGSHLPYAVYSAPIAQLDGYWFLFGGQQSFTAATNSILRAPITSPTSWSINGALPYATSNSQFFTCGNDGYLIGPMIGSSPTGYTPIIHCSTISPTQWNDTGFVVPGVISRSQLAVVYDRMWLFGGSGDTSIFACNQQLKYPYKDPTVLSYVNAVRTVLPTTDNLKNPFQALGFPWWKTDYAFPGRP